MGNFDWVFRRHLERAYLPLLDALERHPAVPFSLHITGPLILWLAEEAPSFLSRVRALVERGQVEMKGGGFFEPILALIPEADAREQLRRMRCYLEEGLGAVPEGVWPAERVWEPHLARLLAEAGMSYAVLDDSHFRSAGVPVERSYGYFVTEEQGRRFDLFPISKDLRYLIPFREPHETLDFLRGLAERWGDDRRRGLLPPDAPPPLVVYDDDGEKFGGWPGTHAHVYEAGWLERFLCHVEEAAAEGWLGLTTPGAFRHRYPPLGRAYVPSASYEEMLEWSGGFFRSFLVRYDEANFLHKRMLYTAGRVRRRLAVLGRSPGAHGAVDPDRPAPPAPCDPGETPAPLLQAPEEVRAALVAYDHVLQAQCNDAYWHGVFGGLYLPHLRDGVTRNLLAAERLLGPAAGPAVESLDLDIDGHDEVILRSPDLVAVVAPARGGSLLAIDHLPSGYALLNSLRRRREPEHEALEQLAAAARSNRSDAASGSGADVGGTGDTAADQAGSGARTIHETVRMKEPGLEHLLFEDRLPRTAFVDRFIPHDDDPGATLDALATGSCTELGDLAGGVYAATLANESAGVALTRSGRADGARVTVDKRVTLAAAAGPSAASMVRVDYAVTLHADQWSTDPPRSRAVRFGPELTINLLAGWEPDRYVLVDRGRPNASALADIGHHQGASAVSLVDEHGGLTVELWWQARLASDVGAPGEDHPATLFRYGVVTVSQSEDGFERIYQGTALLPSWELPLAPGTTLTATIWLRVTDAREPRVRPPDGTSEDPPATYGAGFIGKR